MAGDPVGTGLVASLARPGGNATGFSIQQTDLASKRIELLREIIPGVRRLAIMGNSGSPNSVKDMGEVELTAHLLGLEISMHGVRRTEDIEPAFAALKLGADALYVSGDPFVNTNRIYINTLALSAQMPTVYGFRELTEAGGLIPKRAALYRMDRVFRTCSAVRPTWSTRFCAGPSQPIFRSNSRPSSSWSSI